MSGPPPPPPVPAAPPERWRIQVRGIVQGVGYRPFVYRLAQALGRERPAAPP